MPTLDPETSHEAALSVQPTNLEAQVLECLRGFDQGATSHELAASLGLDLVTVSPRLKPLCKKGLVIDSGVRRMGENGRARTVWTVIRGQMSLNWRGNKVR